MHRHFGGIVVWMQREPSALSTAVDQHDSVRSRAAVKAAVLTASASRMANRGGGSFLGGRVALAIAPDLLATLTRGRTVALVSGTNGKTTTARLLTAAMGGPRLVATSTAGSNLPQGLVMALAEGPRGAPAVLEVDEAYLGAVAAKVDPRVIVLLNLSRDQLDRVSEVRLVAARWREALAGSSAAIVANADDPLVVWAAGGSKNVQWVAAGQLWQQDSVGCPACGGSIERSGSDWLCQCGFRRPRPDASLDGDELRHGEENRFRIDLSLPGRFNMANAAMAAVAAAQLGQPEDLALSAMSAVNEVEGRFSLVETAGVTARLLLSKNPAGWAELLALLSGGEDPVIVGINSKIADGHDPSWLWDVPFEQLQGRTVVSTGTRCGDLAVRLRYAGVDHITEPNPMRALHVTGSRSVEFVGNYTAFQDVRRLIARSEEAGLDPSGGAHEVPTAIPGVIAGRLVPRTRLLSSVLTESLSDAPEPIAPDGEASGGSIALDVDRRSSTRKSDSLLRIVVVHPDLLGTYGDGGNATVIACRAVWRGMGVDLVLAPSDRLLPSSGDVYCIGGGEDGPQVRSATALSDGSLSRAVDNGATVLAVCAGFQIIGATFPGIDGVIRPGVGLLDVSTVRGGGKRSVGEVVAEVEDYRDTPWPVKVKSLTGFENHAGVTHLGAGVRSLATVAIGVGNGGGDGSEGAWDGRVIGTYLHGPVLARNPSFADLLLSLATGEELSQLDDSEEEILRRQRLLAATRVVGSRGVSLAGLSRRFYGFRRSVA